MTVPSAVVAEHLVGRLREIDDEAERRHLIRLAAESMSPRQSREVLAELALLAARFDAAPSAVATTVWRDRHAACQERP